MTDGRDDDRPSHRDFACIDPTRPGKRQSSASGELDDTDDEHRTPVEDVAAKMRAGVASALRAAPFVIPPGYEQIVEMLSIEMAQRMAEIDARNLAAGDSMPRRLHEMTQEVGRLTEWRRKLTGEDDGNGRFGRLTATVAELRADVGTAAERDAERATVKSARWIGAKLIAAIAAVCALVGAAASRVGGQYDAVVEDRGAAREWRRHVDADLDRLFATFNLSRPRPTP